MKHTGIQSKLRGLAAALLVGALAGCGGGGGEGAADGITSQALSGTGTITFIQLNDLHAHMTPHLDRVAVDNPDGSRGSLISERGGLARIATLVKDIRTQNPDSLLMNIGDTYHGGVEAMFSVGNAVVTPLNALGVDVGVPGNWDFAYGPNVTWRRYTDNVPAFILPVGGFLPPEGVLQPNFPNLAANVTVTLGRNAGESFLPPTELRPVGDVMVGLIGITSDIVPMMHPLLAMGLDFAQGEAAYTDIINQQAQALREQGAHIVVVMSELGIQKDFKLAQVINPGAVDIFFSAHTHEATFTPLSGTAGGALVVEAGNDGYLGRMDVTLDQGVITATDWNLLPIEATIVEDPQMAQLVADARAPYLGSNVNQELTTPAGTITLTQSIDTVVGHTDEVIDRRHSLENRFNRVFTDILRDYTGTQVAMTPGFRYDSVLAPQGEPIEGQSYATGEITLEDVYRFFPVSYFLATGETTGAQFKSNLEANLTHVYSTDIFQQGGGWVDGFSGLDIDLDLAQADGQRVQALRYSANQIPVADTDVLSVAGCQRPFDEADVMCSYPGFSNVTLLIDPVTNNNLTPQALFIQALNATPGAANLNGGTRRDISDANNTPQWPDTEFVQPLTGVQ